MSIDVNFLCSEQTKYVRFKINFTLVSEFKTLRANYVKLFLLIK